MEKKKFDLSKDVLINVDSKRKNEEETFQKKPLQPNITEDKNEDYINLTLRVPERKRTEYKVWCAQNRMHMSEAFLIAFDLFIKQSNNNKLVE